MNTILQEQALQILDEDVLFELNKIYNKSTRNRLIRELIELKKRNAYIHVEYIECENIYKNNNNNNINLHFIINITIILKDEGNVYKFELSSDYPFRAPKKFTINYTPYLNYLKIDSKKTMLELKKYKGIGCLCCSSINCASIWSPSTDIVRCINEFKEFKQYRRDIINKLLAEKITNRYLINDINLLEWLF